MCILFLIPAMIHAQSYQTGTDSPPISQQLVREGDFAIKLNTALGLESTQDEVEAESQLGEVGIAPRNGWIADYPVTPDIINELQKSVSDAAIAQRLPDERDEALHIFQDTVADLNLSIRPYASNQPHPSGPEQYPDQTVINNYYSNQGPPVVTYYAPPPDYDYLYSWVPCPFWWVDFWFGGYFILHDFHRVEFVNHRAVFVTNHFNDRRDHRVFRVDAISRFNGRSFAGIGAPHNGRTIAGTGASHNGRTVAGTGAPHRGRTIAGIGTPHNERTVAGTGAPHNGRIVAGTSAPHRGNFISTGVPKSERTIFNGTRTRMMSRERMSGQIPHGGKGSFIRGGFIKKR
jgi:hypothetical protein